MRLHGGSLGQSCWLQPLSSRTSEKPTSHPLDGGGSHPTYPFRCNMLGLACASFPTPSCDPYRHWVVACQGTRLPPYGGYTRAICVCTHNDMLGSPGWSICTTPSLIGRNSPYAALIWRCQLGCATAMLLLVARACNFGLSMRL
jgi:hypothetical protein